MTVSKHVTINLGNYESLKLGVDEAPSYEEADRVIIAELRRLGISTSEKIKRCLSWAHSLPEWMGDDDTGKS